MNNINLPQGTALTAKILLGIVKQGPIYLSPRLAIDYTIIIWLVLHEDNEFVRLDDLMFGTSPLKRVGNISR